MGIGVVVGIKNLETSLKLLTFVVGNDIAYEVGYGKTFSVSTSFDQGFSIGCFG